jgi:uncharacterized membrane protein
MSRNNLSKIILPIVILSIVILSTQRVFAIGQMTKPIVIENVLRGQIVQETLILYSSEAKEMTYGLIAEGEIENWAKFYLANDLENPISQLPIPANSQTNAIVQFQIPEDAPNGTYTGTVAFFSLPEKEKNEGITASVGVRVDREVSITITDKEILKFETTIIPLKYGVRNGEPLKIKVIYDNQGNVSIKPDIQLKIIQISTGNTIHNAIYPYPEGENPVKPFERREFPNLIEWPTAGQENGKYKAEIKVLLNGEVMEEESFRFDVGVNIWALLLAAIYPFVSNLGGGNLMFGWFVLGGILLILAGILTFFYKRPKLLKVLANPIRNAISNGINKIKSLF